MASGAPPGAVTSLNLGSQSLCSGHLSLAAHLTEEAPSSGTGSDRTHILTRREWENYSACVTAGKAFQLPQHSAKAIPF